MNKDKNKQTHLFTFTFTYSRPQFKKPKPVYEPKKKQSGDELPVDDVYIVSDHRQQEHDLMTCIQKVKKHAWLDFADEDAIVNLKIDFKSLSQGGKKKKKQVWCWYCKNFRFL